MAGREAPRRTSLNLCPREKERKFLEPVRLQPKQKPNIPCTLTYFNSPSEIWVQLSVNSLILGALMKELETVGPTFMPLKPDTFKVGDMVAVEYENEWCRAKVTSIALRIGIQYVDYGNRDEVSASQVFDLPEECKNLAPLATQCSLARVKERDWQTGWGQAACALLAKFMKKKTISVECIALNETVALVDFYDYDKGKSASDLLFENGFALRVPEVVSPLEAAPSRTRFGYHGNLREPEVVSPLEAAPSEMRSPTDKETALYIRGLPSTKTIEEVSALFERETTLRPHTVRKDLVRGSWFIAAFYTHNDAQKAMEKLHGFCVDKSSTPLTVTFKTAKRTLCEGDGQRVGEKRVTFSEEHASSLSQAQYPAQRNNCLALAETGDGDKAGPQRFDVTTDYKALYITNIPKHFNERRMRQEIEAVASVHPDSMHMEEHWCIAGFHNSSAARTVLRKLKGHRPIDCSGTLHVEFKTKKVFSNEGNGHISRQVLEGAHHHRSSSQHRDRSIGRDYCTRRSGQENRKYESSSEKSGRRNFSTKMETNALPNNRTLFGTPYQLIPEKGLVSCTVSYVASPWEIWLTLPANAAIRSAMMRAMSCQCPFLEHVGPSSVEKSQRIGVKVVEEWHRFWVISTDPLIAQNIDIGGAPDEVAFEDAVSLPEEFENVPPLAIRCRLADVEQSRANRWSNEACQLLKTFTQDNMKVECLGQEQATMLIRLVNSSGESASDMLVKKNLARTVPKIQSPKKEPVLSTPKQSSCTDLASCISQLELSAPKTEMVPATPFILFPNPASYLSKVSRGEKLQLMVCDTPTGKSCIMTVSPPEIVRMMRTIHHDAETLPRCQPSPGDVVLAKPMECGWFRAYVVSSENDNFSVIDIDHWKRVEVKYVVNMPELYRKIPGLAVLCHLDEEAPWMKPGTILGKITDTDCPDGTVKCTLSHGDMKVRGTLVPWTQMITSMEELPTKSRSSLDGATVKLTWFEDCNKVYLVKKDELADLVCKLTRVIEEAKGKAALLELPRVNDLVACKLEKSYYRALVTSTFPGRREVEVRLVDTGSKVTTLVDTLARLDKAFQDLPYLAELAHLHNVPASLNKKDDVFHKCLEKTVTCVVRSYEPLTVELYSPKGKCVNELLCKAVLPVAACQESVLSQLVVEEVVSLIVREPLGNLAGLATVNTSKNEIVSLSTITSVARRSPRCEPLPGEIALVRSASEACWMRAYVKEVMGDAKIKVIGIDCCVEEEVEEAVKMPEGYKDIPALGVRCDLEEEGIPLEDMITATVVQTRDADGKVKCLAGKQVLILSPWTGVMSDPEMVSF